MAQKGKHKIFIQEWLELHPNEKPMRSDFFYLRLCNEVNELIGEHASLLFIMLEEEAKKQLSCMLVAWFEDVISETGIWKAFINQNMDLHGKHLPFYDLEEYYPDEINPQDVQFLLWYYTSMHLRETMDINPASPEIAWLSEEIFELFDSNWDVAPANESLKKFLYVSHEEQDYYAVRYKFDWLVMNSYLFFFYGEENNEQKIEYIERLEKEDRDPEFISAYIKELHDIQVHNTITHLHAGKGHQWMGWMLGKDHPLYQALLNTGEKKTGRYLYLSDDSSNYYFRHIASGVEVAVSKKSLDENRMIPGKTVLNMGLIRWIDAYWFSGILFEEELSDEILLEETADPEKSNLFRSNASLHEAVYEQFKSFLDFNNGSPIAFFNSIEDLNKFMTAFLNFYNQNLEQAKGRKGKKFTEEEFLKPEGLKDIPEESQNFMLFFNKEIGTEFVLGYNHLIPDPENEAYDPDHKVEDVLDLISQDTISPALFKYLFQHYEFKKPYFPGDDGGKLLKENLEFLLRFHKPTHYHERPQVLMV